MEDVEFTYTQTSVEMCDIEFEDGGEYVCVTGEGATSIRRTTHISVVNSTGKNNAVTMLNTVGKNLCYFHMQFQLKSLH